MVWKVIEDGIQYVVLKVRFAESNLVNAKRELSTRRFVNLNERKRVLLNEHTILYVL